MGGPRDTACLVGQEPTEQRLLRSLQSGRLPHAWLMTGKPGIGKATLAYRMARFLLARPDGYSGFGGDLSIDPEDSVFRQVAARAHPDLLVLERGVNERSGKPRSEIVVEEVRKIGERLRHTAFGSGWRLLIVDSADEMNRSAANALLKLLEEPPPQALLLLISHAPGRLLPTIRSRCCSLPLAPLPDRLVIALMAEQLPDLTDEERRRLAVLAEGSIGKAVALYEAGGLQLYRRILAVLNRAGQGMGVTEAHRLAEELGGAKAGDSFKTAFALLNWWLARVISAGARGQLPPPVVEEEAGLARRLLARRALADWVGLWEKLSALAECCERMNLDRKQALLSALIDLDVTA
ncbi:MAG: DNA polymerase III subunit delta' [Rhodospirillales bacterium]|nr:DNA polymerase III subunit delta' [Rhodospirillales bacterium]